MRRIWVSMKCGHKVCLNIACELLLYVPYMTHNALDGSIATEIKLPSPTSKNISYTISDWSGFHTKHSNALFGATILQDYFVFINEKVFSFNAKMFTLRKEK